jgi:type II secretory pathway component PulF
MKKGIFCSQCGTNNTPHRFKCTECHALIRPVYPTVLAVAALLAIYLQWLLFMKSVVPVFAHILSSRGGQFSPLVLTAIAVGGHFTGWGVLFGLAFIAGLAWLGLFWRPQKSLGRNLVITVALAKAVGAMVFALLAALDVLPYIAVK